MSLLYLGDNMSIDLCFANPDPLICTWNQTLKDISTMVTKLAQNAKKLMHKTPNLLKLVNRPISNMEKETYHSTTWQDSFHHMPAAPIH